MKGGLGNLMKQAQKMQEGMQKAQEEIANMQVTGVSGGGMVAVTINGRHECRRVKIDKSLMEDDVDMIEDLVAAAINDATHKLDAESKGKMSGITSGINLPPGFKMPF